MKQHSATVITAPPLAGGFVFGIACYLIAYAIDPGQALIGAGVGIVVGFLAVALFWWTVYERWITPPAPRREVALNPLELQPAVIELKRGNTLSIRDFCDSLGNYDNLVWVVKHLIPHYRVTYDKLVRPGKITRNMVSDFQDQLVDYNLAYWKSVDEYGNPNRKQGLRVTKECRELFEEFSRQTPSPTRLGW